MTRRAIGNVRPSQVITTFGPGSIVDLPTLSVIVAGIDHWPVDEDFLAALDHGLPDCAGIALGFDRLAMLATGAPRIEDVLWLPVR